MNEEWADFDIEDADVELECGLEHPEECESCQ